MRAEVAFLCRVIFRVDENGVVRTSGHARLATDADRFIKIDDAVGALEHCCRRTSGNAGRVCALIAAGDLMRAPGPGKLPHVDVLDVRAGDADGYDVLGFAGSRTRMATNAARVVDDLRPLDLVRAVEHKFSQG